jgi:PDZ domain/Aspartyl protease
MNITSFKVCNGNPPSPASGRFGACVGAALLTTGLTLAMARAQQASTPAPVKVEIKAVIPFEVLPTNHMLVKAKINGKGPYHLVFDLGAPITLLNNRVSETSGVIKANAPRSILFGMRGEAEIDKLQVGELTVNKLPVIIFDHPLLNALEKIAHRRIDGLMGFTFFARYRTTIDYHSREMTFEPIDYQVHDLLKELPDRLLSPKVARRRILVPGALYGLRLGAPDRSLDSPGVVVAEVLPDSPAARAGFKAGDLMIALDDRWTTSLADVFCTAAEIKPGRPVSAVIRRDGKERTLTIHPVAGA